MLVAKIFACLILYTRRKNDLIHEMLLKIVGDRRIPNRAASSCANPGNRAETRGQQVAADDFQLTFGLVAPGLLPI
jgi:hypothetical protein